MTWQSNSPDFAMIGKAFCAKRLYTDGYCNKLSGITGIGIEIVTIQNLKVSIRKERRVTVKQMRAESCFNGNLYFGQIRTICKAIAADAHNRICNRHRFEIRKIGK